MDNIHGMELHQVVHEPQSNIEITRVDGGWLYYYLFRKSTVFVPDAVYPPIYTDYTIPITSITTSLDDIKVELREIATQGVPLG